MYIRDITWNIQCRLVVFMADAFVMRTSFDLKLTFR